MSGGETIIAQVARWQSDTTVVLNTGTVAPNTNAIITVVCPAFTAAAKGKYLIEDRTGLYAIWPTISGTLQLTRPGRPAVPTLGRLAICLHPAR